MVLLFVCVRSVLAWLASSLGAFSRVDRHSTPTSVSFAVVAHIRSFVSGIQSRRFDWWVLLSLGSIHPTSPGLDPGEGRSFPVQTVRLSYVPPSPFPVPSDVSFPRPVRGRDPPPGSFRLVSLGSPPGSTDWERVGLREKGGMRRGDLVWDQTRSSRGFEPDPPPFGRIGSSDVDDAPQAHTNPRGRVGTDPHHDMAMASAELMAYCYGELAAAYARCAAAARGAAVGEAIPLHDAPVVFEQPKVRGNGPVQPNRRRNKTQETQATCGKSQTRKPKEDARVRPTVETLRRRGGLARRKRRTEALDAKRTWN